MNIRDLKYLVSVAEHQHFGKAAEACFVSQPALSMQIQKLEEILGLKLLERTNKSVLLTDAGFSIVERAKEILTQVDELHEFAKQAKDQYSGELKIGIFPTLAPYLLPLIIPALSKKYPKLSFYLVEMQTAGLIEKLKLGKLDAVFLALPIPEKGVFNIPLFEEEFMLAVPENHTLSKLKSINPIDLANKKLLLLDEGHCLRDQALSFCKTVKVDETQNFRATSLETLRHMIASGVGMTLMPKLACQVNPNITYIPFNAPRPARSISLVWREKTARHGLLEEISGALKNILSKHNEVEVIR